MNSPKRASNLAVPVRPSNLKQAAVFDDLRAIYLHIGRAASSSIKHILGTQSNTPKETVIKWCWGEMPLIDVTDERFKDYLFFTFIRNPWDRLASTYYSKIYNPPNSPGSDFYRKAMVTALGSTDYSFESFLHFVDLVPDPNCDVHWNSQYLTVFDENFQPVPQVIGHYDKLNDELPEICNSLGIKCPISNQSGSKRTEPYTSFYTDETREYVAKRYHLDIEIFQFSYGENSQTQGTK